MSTYGYALYQIVFSTKYREKTLIKTNREELYRYIWGVLKNKKCYLYRIGGVDDHLHIIVDLHPSQSLSNLIKDIIIMPNGLVYFATDQGLCSYMSDVTATNEEMTKDNVYAYPNPVKPDYTGSINIVGLSFHADIKIVSVNGTLVNQGKSTGGSYSWDGCDLKGRKVASGIYMVETATSEGERGVVCKIAIIK